MNTTGKLWKRWTGKSRLKKRRRLLLERMVQTQRRDNNGTPKMPGLRMIAQKRAGTKALLLPREALPRKVPPKKASPRKVKRPKKVTHQVHVKILKRRMLKLEEFLPKKRSQLKEDRRHLKERIQTLKEITRQLKEKRRWIQTLKEIRRQLKEKRRWIQMLKEIRSSQMTNLLDKEKRKISTRKVVKRKLIHIPLQ
jgi:hypothetical protein